MCGGRIAGHGKGFVSRGAPDLHAPVHCSWIGTDSMSPRSQVVAAVSVLAPVVLSGVALVLLIPGLWWIFTIYGWISFPAFALLMRGLSGAGTTRSALGSGERELLRVLRRYGEVSPALAAMETSLSVAEAEAILRKLAGGGHLTVLARGGGLHYALWESESRGQIG